MTIEHNDGGTIFTGADSVRVYQAAVIMRAIDLYLKTGMRVNRAYTPTNMLLTAAKITGLGPYQRGKRGLQHAAMDLGLWLNKMREG